ncbi:hypothetical protein [Anaeroselena agilis]|uniref:Uncharacterized protein n=1 Tax=Anaeroselena agilis TaxID=3063788 RepID=A0ABU3NYI4_9FIRM|nr:hypothetical protein [Selenomonadales bacterium 4137-cl]
MKCDTCYLGKTDPAQCETCWAAPIELQTNPERCSSCGSLPTMPHLRNCQNERRPGGPQFNKPTVRMMDKAYELQRELGYETMTDPATLNMDECSKFIDRLIKEKEEGLYEAG